MKLKVKVEVVIAPPGVHPCDLCCLELACSEHAFAESECEGDNVYLKITKIKEKI